MLKSAGSDAQKSEQKSEKIDGSFSYNLNLGNRFKSKPFEFMEALPLIGEAIAASEIGYLPTSVAFSGSMVESKTSSVSRNLNATPFKPSHKLTMSRRYNLDWNLLPTVNAKFNANLSNDLDSLKNRKKDTFFGFSVSAPHNC